MAGLSTFTASYQRGCAQTTRLSFIATSERDGREQGGGVLTEAGSVPAVVVWGAAGDAVVTQQPITCHFAPQADAADARPEVSGAALTVRAAPCSQEESTINTMQRRFLPPQNQRQTAAKFNSFRPSVAFSQSQCERLTSDSSDGVKVKAHWLDLER